MVEGTYQIKGGSLSASLLAEADEGDLIRTVRNGAIITVYVNGKQVGTSNVNVSVLATGTAAMSFPMAIGSIGAVYRCFPTAMC